MKPKKKDTVNIQDTKDIILYYVISNINIDGYDYGDKLWVILIL